jgi:hypothetical protein
MDIRCIQSIFPKRGQNLWEIRSYVIMVSSTPHIEGSNFMDVTASDNHINIYNITLNQYKVSEKTFKHWFWKFIYCADWLKYWKSFGRHYTDNLVYLFIVGI